MMEMFVEKIFPHGRRLYQEKHSSQFIENFLDDKWISWWYTPQESPDMNSIELVGIQLSNF